MGSKVILAVAGSGKTYRICQEVPEHGKTLVLAFTHSNVNNILRELSNSWKRRFGRPVPEAVRVMTFDSFVCRYAVAPYIKTIAAYFKVPPGRFKGFTLKDPPMIYMTIGGKPVPKQRYNKDQILHYIDKNGDFYVANLCELVMMVKKDRDSLIKKVATAVSLFWDQVFVDEFQDFRKHDYDFLLEIAKKTGRLMMVGDYYQHSVVADKSKGKPFEVAGRDVPYDEFVKKLLGQKIDVDMRTLNSSRRCPECICLFVRERLGISMRSSSQDAGSLQIVGADTIDKVMRDDTIVKLVWNEARKKAYKANNWSYSKGDTYEKACVVLTGSTDHILERQLESDVGSIVRNRLYVALTRASSELYIVPSGIYRQWEKENLA